MATKAAPKKAKTEAKGNDIPKSSLTSAITTDLPQTETGPTEPAKPDKYDGLGLVKVDGIDFRYVGLAPARDKDPKTPSGYPITQDNSTFLPLPNVAFDPSIKVKDPASGEFYMPGDDCRSWDDCNLNGSYLVERKK